MSPFPLLFDAAVRRAGKHSSYSNITLPLLPSSSKQAECEALRMFLYDIDIFSPPEKKTSVLSAGKLFVVSSRRKMFSISLCSPNHGHYMYILLIN